MKRLLTLAIAAIALASAAMPTKEEIRKAAPLVGELMNPLVAEYKAKKKTAVEVGDSAMVYAKEAETEAAKFLLLKGAIWYFAQAKDDAKAVKATSLLREQVKNIPPKMLINDVLKPAIDRIGEQDVPGLFVQYRAASARAMIASGDISRQQRAELLAVAEGWKEALAAFAKLGDTPPAKAARAEKEGKNLAAAADFWWSYAPEEESAKDAIKAHAAALYRKAIASGELTGLKKAIAEKRIATLPDSDSFVASTAKAEPAPAASEPPKSNVPVASTPSATPQISLSANGRPKDMVLDLGGGVKMEMVGCPAGKFYMGTKEYPQWGPIFKGHTVELTRSFWIGKFPVTIEQWERLMPQMEPPQGVKRRDMDPKLPVQITLGMSPLRRRVEDFAAKLTRKFQDRLPRGYVFRLPTSAEWEYALLAGKEASEVEGTLRASAVTPEDSKAYWQSKGLAIRAFDENDAFAKKPGLFPYVPVGTRPPNAWNLYDMVGVGGEAVLDSWNNTYGRTRKLRSFNDVANENPSIWTDGVKDPLLFEQCQKGGDVLSAYARGTIRRGWSLGMWLEWEAGYWLMEKGPVVRVRLVIGPDLMKERGITPPGAPAASSAPAASAPSATPQISLSANGRPKNKILQLGNGEKIDMIGCPAGSFQMSNCHENGKKQTFHKVTITRPFWFSKTMLTARQMEGIGLAPDDRKSLVDQVAREFPDQQVVLTYPPDVVKGVFDSLNGSLASILPSGYVFRLPTEAELEYAWSAAGTDMGFHVLTGNSFKAFVAKGWLSKAEFQYYNYWSKSKFRGIFLLPNGFPKNAWGINKLCETPFHFTLDRSPWRFGELNHVYAVEEIDPVQRFEDAASPHMSRRGFDRLGAKHPACVTLVIGPDLLKERGIAQPSAK